MHGVRRRKLLTHAGFEGLSRSCREGRPRRLNFPMEKGETARTNETPPSGKDRGRVDDRLGERKQTWQSSAERPARGSDGFAPGSKERPCSRRPCLPSAHFSLISQSSPSSKMATPRAAQIEVDHSRRPPLRFPSADAPPSVNFDLKPAEMNRAASSPWGSAPGDECRSFRRRARPRNEAGNVLMTREQPLTRAVFLARRRQAQLTCLPLSRFL